MYEERGAFAGFRGYESGAGQDAVDRRRRRDVQAFTLEVPSDRDRSGIQSSSGEIRAECDDSVDDFARRGSRIASRPPGLRIDGVETVLAVACEQPVQLSPRQPVLLGRFGHGELPSDDLQDHNPVLRHASNCDS